VGKNAQVDRVRELPKSTSRGTFSSRDNVKRIRAIFYRTEAGNEPLRDWLKGMPAEDRRLIGEDIKTVEFGWPVGMPTCRPLGDGLYEVRTNLSDNRIVRVFFYVDAEQRMVLLHGILKRTRTTPEADLKLARQNKRKHKKGII
jgi:phage-related protein